MTGFWIIVCHLFGDYVLQSQWMAVNKRRSFAVATLHASAYSLPFWLVVPGSETGMMPTFTLIDGIQGKRPAFCSAEWKRDVIARYLRATGVESCVNWIGISLDEMDRVRTPRSLWMQLRYPLIFDLPMRRSDCKQAIREMGWPEAPKSACWMCPNHSDAGWREMKRDYPEDFTKAVNLERELRQRDPEMFLHRSCKPLDEIDFDAQHDLFAASPGCDSGYCFV